MCIGNHKQYTHTHTPTHVDTRTHCDFTRVRDDFLSALLAWLLSLSPSLISMGLSLEVVPRRRLRSNCCRKCRRVALLKKFVESVELQFGSCS